MGIRSYLLWLISIVKGLHILVLRLFITSFAAETVAIRHVRTCVFQQEQGIAEGLDWDGKDETAQQIVAYWAEQPVGTARLRPLSESACLKLERVAVLRAFRGRGIGRAIVAAAVTQSATQSASVLVLNAQLSTVEFYQKLGFTPVGQPFEEAGIAHLKMRFDCLVP